MSIFDVGLTVAGIVEAIEQLNPNKFSRNNVTIAGYSLGAHAAGYAGAVLNGEIEQIIGLDPAGPLFTIPSVVSTNYRLDQSDAMFVQILHTSAYTLGSGVKSGHADFYPNGGKAPQPNCRMFTSLQDFQSTSELEDYLLFTCFYYLFLTLIIFLFLLPHRSHWLQPFISGHFFQTIYGSFLCLHRLSVWQF